MKGIMKRIVGIALSVAICISFMPVLGNGAYAETINGNKVIPETDGTDVMIDAKSVYTGKVDAKYYTINLIRTGDTIKLSGTIAQPYSFGVVMVDDANHIVGQGSGKYQRTLNATIDMNKYDVGYHTIVVQLWKTSNLGNSSAQAEDLWYAEKQVTNLKATPNYNGVFDVYSTYFTYNPFDFGKNMGGYYLYMDYSADGGKTWKTSGYMKVNSIQLYRQQSYKISGLKPNTVYKTRIYYGKNTTYALDGKTYFIKGPVLNTTTIKTGAAAKPAIKSIKVKAKSVKKHKIKHYGYYTGVYLYTEKFYTYKVKVTVKLKKKPGTAGIWINGKYVKGNKKKYTVTLPGSAYSVKKPKGKKYGLVIASYQNPGYGGYSPLYTTKKKIK